MKKAAAITGLVLATVFLILGIASVTPDKYIKSWGDGKMYEYVGGDAYNYIIEAALRGGEISGAKTARAVYFSAAGILLVLSLSFLAYDDGKDRINDSIRLTRQSVDKIREDVDRMLSAQQSAESGEENVYDPAPSEEGTGESTATDQPVWVDIEKGFVKCPCCNNRLSLDFIRARGKCPACGCSYYR